jgi:tetratricopeptide (TPR) repeat protein
LARQHLEISKKFDDITAIADGNAILGVVLWLLGKFQEALARHEKAITIHKEMEHFEHFLEYKFNKCWIKMEMGGYSQALDEVQSALVWYRGEADKISRPYLTSYSGKAGLLSDAYLTGYALSIQGDAFLALGGFAEAENLLQESITAFQQTVICI